MSDIRAVTDRFAVSPQISVEDVASAADEGFASIINNRPDGETPDQPNSAAIEAAARAAGLAYVHIPVVGRPGPAEVAAMSQALDRGAGKVLAFCRSGTRSIMTWALSRAAAGEFSRDELVRIGAAAGYDLSPIL